jgi:Archaeal PaREP1/PaREP8 family.
MLKKTDVLTASDVLLEEADQLLEKGDTVQASEKYYKAAEEAVKLLAKTLKLTSVLNKAEKNGEWDLRVLHEAVNEASQVLNNPELFEYWESAVAVLTANLSMAVLKRKRKT